MYQYTVSLDGESVGVRSKTDLSLMFARWKELPHLGGVEVHGGQAHEFVIEYVDAQDSNVSYSGKQAIITMPLPMFQDGELLLYVALPFLEVLHQRKQIVTIHAASVELAGKAILLLGKAGAGKTSLTLSLCQNHGAKLIGNDIVKVGLVDGKIFACAGSKYFFLRQESIKRNLPELLSLFPQSGKDSWTHKIYCLPERLGISTCQEYTLISKSYLVHVDETMQDQYSESADKMDTRLYLHENMSRYIRGTAVALFGNGSRFLGYIPSFDSPDFFEMRAGLMEKIISETNMVYVAGNIHDTCKRIVDDAGV